MCDAETRDMCICSDSDFVFKKIKEMVDKNGYMYEGKSGNWYRFNRINNAGTNVHRMYFETTKCSICNGPYWKRRASGSNAHMLCRNAYNGAYKRLEMNIDIKNNA